MELWFDEMHNKYSKLSMKVKEHLCSVESPFQKIDVLDTYEYGRVLVLDGFIMLTEKDEFVYHEMIVHTPLAVNPDIKKVLVIGAGDGGTLRELTRYKTIESIDFVEIDKMVVEISKKYLPFLNKGFDDERITAYFKDGIEFVKGKENIYDLIIIDSTDPIGPGEGLFTTEFYNNCYKALNNKGILVNQCESAFYEKDRAEFERAIKKLKNIFPITEVYQANIPTYASGNWLFGFASKNYHPIKDHKPAEWEKLKLDTKYYNSKLHKGSFYLPNYILDILGK
ncbi:polyamine aminopropyltransferase [Tepidimicrobium xylanilyticum]|uniref:Polyamine aminopropyltransferase n=1 Tax=Tepidimicrobium xylanilyticum TaxID=1123352 RepID=A0A1H2WHC2_9FIRM|nr:polyamine aminopropyltransferase [Tepidimicrobium xylanilyticum]GMG95246.1 polyamine aminopropyltransferase [Tepidimicrobium xylanilyticum]SDW79654.1 spermidine synthase [Tepidimicrobium xylanilyticum]